MSNAIIIKHVERLSLEYSGGRSEKAAQLHSIQREAPRPQLGETNGQTIGRAPIPDHWSERGELGRWVRVHSTPRTEKFDPNMAPRGPRRKTRLRGVRVTQGVRSNGEKFREEDVWNDGRAEIIQTQPWTGTTTFVVDKTYSKEYGTDQRRQRVSFENYIRQARFSKSEQLAWADFEVNEGDEG